MIEYTFLILPVCAAIVFGMIAWLFWLYGRVQ